MAERLSNRLVFGLVLMLGGLIGFAVLAQVTPAKQGGQLSAPPSEPTSNFALFCDTVVPLLETRCATGCHGVDPQDYKRFRADAVHASFFYFPFDAASGRIPLDAAMLQNAYDAARSTARIEYGEDAVFSPLMRVPLSETYGGLPHRGLDVFYSPKDPGYETLWRWVLAEIDARPVAEKPLPAEIRFFRDHVLGVMERNACFTGSCHGPMVANDLKLRPPLPVEKGREAMGQRLSRSMLLANRSAMLGEVCNLANLGGDLRQSRLLLKNIPICKGGIHQRGGNDQFFESLDDPDAQLVLQWLALERKALVSRLTAGGRPVAEADLGRLTGVAFIRGPRHAPRQFFDADTFWPGSDIWLSRVADDGTAIGEPVNLSARLHAAPVEIQALDVRYDGSAIVFSMRRGADEGFRLFELQLEDGLYREASFRQISFGAMRQADGSLVHHLDPCYMPGPDDREGTRLDDVGIAFSSNAAGASVASNAFGVLGEADGGYGNVLLDAQRTEASGTFDEKRIHLIAGPGAGQSRRIVAHYSDDASVVGSQLVLDAPLNFALDSRTVYEIEVDIAEYRAAYDIWRTVPGKDAQLAWAKARRATFSNAQERRPSMRTDGEVMFTSVRNVGYQDGRPVFNGAIFRVRNGGWDYHIHGGNRSRYPLYVDSRELPSGLEIRQALDPRNLWGGGLLLLADHGFGVNVEPENPVDHFAYPPAEPAYSGVRFIPSQIPLFPEVGNQAVTVTGRSPGGSYRDAYPLPDGRILVARAGGFDHLDPNADPDWDLCWLRFPESMQSPDGSRSGQVQINRLDACSSPAYAEYCPRPVMIRLKEKPDLHQKMSTRQNLPKGVIEQGVERLPIETPADIECYDYPLLEAFLTNFAPLEPRNIRDSELRFVRLVAQETFTRADARRPMADAFDPPHLNDPFATLDSLGVHTRKRILAEIPLEPDGSFYAAVPPNLPILIQGLNAQRMALHSMNRWFYTQPGERLTFSIPRSIFPTRCGACHGSLTGNPDEQLGPPDIASASSQVMANWDPTTLTRRRPVGLAENSAVPGGIDFVRDVQPILDRKCVACHGKASTLDLTGAPQLQYTRSYINLHQLDDPASRNYANKRWVNEREGLAIKSHLIELVMGVELNAPRTLSRPGIKHPESDPLSDSELLTLIRWIDLGATFRGGRQ